MFFCEDVDLLPWEPGIFFEDAFAHQGIIREAAGTLTGTALVMDAAVLGGAEPGMVAQVETVDGAFTQLLELVTVADARHATLSALRARTAQEPILPLTGGEVNVSIRTFRPQIAAVGDALLALIGVASDRQAEPVPVSAKLRGFRTAAIFGTLAAVFRTLNDGADANAGIGAKQSFYENLARSTRRAVAGMVDGDGDGAAEDGVVAALPVLERM